MPALASAILAALLVPSDAEDAKIRVTARLVTLPPHFRAQLLGEMDRPVGDGFTIAGTEHEVRKDDRDRVKVDVRGDKRFRTLSGRQLPLSFSVKGEGKRPKTFTLKFLFTKTGDDASPCTRSTGRRTPRPSCRT